MKEKKVPNPKDRAASSRLDITLFPQTAIVYGALGMTEGDCKYAGYNYRAAKVSFSVYVAALLRHVFKLYNGEWADAKTKVPHLASILASAGILVDAHECNSLIDDRPPRADVTRLLSECEEIVKHLQTIFPDGPPRFTEVGLKRSNGETLQSKKRRRVLHANQRMHPSARRQRVQVGRSR